jgi:hypothetical protein
VRLLLGGDQAYRDAQYRQVMRRVLAHELARHANAEFDDGPYLDAGNRGGQGRPDLASRRYPGGSEEVALLVDVEPGPLPPRQPR